MSSRRAQGQRLSTSRSGIAHRRGDGLGDARDGRLEATRRLKGDPRTMDVPVVMVTAHTTPEHRRAAEEAGCAAFLPKPADLDDLLTELRRVLAGA